jgi:hypothetical protein
MCHIRWFISISSLAFVVPCAARPQNPDFMYAVRIPKLGGLACVDGRAGFFDSDRAAQGDREGATKSKPKIDREAAVEPKEIELAWKITRAEKGHTLQVRGTQKYHGWYLSYDPERPQRGVFLSKERTGGSYWEIQEIPTLSKPTYPIRARIPDPERRWYLDYDPDAKTYMKSRVKGTNGVDVLYSAKLTEGKGPAINMYELAP